MFFLFFPIILPGMIVASMGSAGSTRLGRPEPLLTLLELRQGRRLQILDINGHQWTKLHGYAVFLWFGLVVPSYKFVGVASCFDNPLQSDMIMISICAMAKTLRNCLYQEMVINTSIMMDG